VFGEENGDSREIVSSLRASASRPARSAAIGAGLRASCLPCSWGSGFRQALTVRGWSN